MVRVENVVNYRKSIVEVSLDDSETHDKQKIILIAEKLFFLKLIFIHNTSEIQNKLRFIFMNT